MAIYSSETNRYLKQKKNRILKYEVIKHGVIIFFLLTILLPLAQNVVIKTVAPVT